MKFDKRITKDKKTIAWLCDADNRNNMSYDGANYVRLSLICPTIEEALNARN